MRMKRWIVAAMLLSGTAMADDLADLRKLFVGKRVVSECVGVVDGKPKQFEAGGRVLAMRDRASMYVVNERDAAAVKLEAIVACNVIGAVDLGKAKPAGWPMSVVTVREAPAVAAPAAEKP